jgi:hypothetical protein
MSQTEQGNFIYFHPPADLSWNFNDRQGDTGMTFAISAPGKEGFLVLYIVGAVFFASHRKNLKEESHVRGV